MPRSTPIGAPTKRLRIWFGITSRMRGGVGWVSLRFDPPYEIPETAFGKFCEPVALARNFGFSPKELRRIQRLVSQHQAAFLEGWHGHHCTNGRRACRRREDHERHLKRVIRGRAERNNWRIAGGGYGIDWPDIDEDLSTEGLLRGAPAPRSDAVEDTKENTRRRTER